MKEYIVSLLDREGCTLAACYCRARNDSIARAKGQTQLCKLDPVGTKGWYAVRAEAA